MNRKIYFISVVCLLICYSLSAQTNLPNIIPPSPEAASITKFVDMKINEYQGMIQKNIPLYSIRNGSITVPVSLNYQSGGFKVIESTGSVGLGWQLQAGGVVTRSMNGLPDNRFSTNPGITKSFLQVISEVTYDYLMSGANDNLRYDYLQQASKGCYDTQPDIFSFNFNGYMGKFHFDWDGNIIVNAESKISVEPIWSNDYNSRINGWIFKTPDGFTYRFTTAENTTNLSTTGASYCFTPTQSFNSAWYLAEIADAQNYKKIFFEYDPYLIEDHYIFKSLSRLHRVSVDQNCNDLFEVNSPVNNSITNVNIDGRRLKRIYSNSSAVEVLFTASTKLVSSNSDDFYALGEVVVKNRFTNSTIKKFVLTHDYSTARLTLKSVQEFGRDDAYFLPPYTFEYHGSLEGRKSNKRDHWGYGNINASQDLFPPYLIETEDRIIRGYGDADRSPDFEGSRSGILYKIKYPTGGYDEYSYELNTYGFVGSTLIDDYKTEEVFKSVQAQGPSGIPCTSIVTDYDGTTFTIAPNPNVSAPETEQRILVSVYGYVSKYTDDYFSAGKSPKCRIVNSSGNVIVSITLTSGTVNKYISLPPGDYSMTAEATWKDCDTNARDRAYIRVKYDNYTDELLLEKPAGGVRVSKLEKFDSDSRLLLSQEYSYKTDGDYSSGFIHKEPEYTFPLQKYEFVSNGQPVGGADIGCNFVMALDNDISNLGVTDGGHMGYKRVTVKQVSNTNAEDAENGETVLNFRTVSNVVYDPIPIRPNKNNSFYSGLISESITRDNAGNDVLRQDFDYDFHADDTYAIRVYFKGGLVIPGDEFKFDKGRYTVSIGHSKVSKEETISFLGGQIHRTLEEYTYDGKAQNLKERKTNDSDGYTINKYYYPEEYAQLDNLSTTEQAAYQGLSNNHLFPIIQTDLYVNKANEPQTKMGSFRTIYQDFGTVTPLPGIVETSKATDDLEPQVIYYDYDTNGNPLEVSQADGTHIVYIWGYQDELPIAKVENATSDELSDYVANLKDKSNADNDHCLSAGCGEQILREALSDLRAAFPNAMVTTYTYDPLVGITSMTDPRGYTVYYEYDNLNRLIKVKDADQNLISENKYHYQTQD